MHLLHSFYSFDYVLKIKITNVTRLLIKAKERENEDLLIQRWMLNHSREMSLQDFKDKVIIHRTEDNKTTEEILIDVKNTIETFNKQVVK